MFIYCGFTIMPVCYDTTLKLYVTTLVTGMLFGHTLKYTICPIHVHCTMYIIYEHGSRQPIYYYIKKNVAKRLRRQW